MSQIELDHIFIRTTKGAREADLLLTLGLVEGTPNRHPGQGTSNRRFFFNNMMLEFLWIEDLDEVQNEMTRPMTLMERLLPTAPDNSPFGICLRPSGTKDVKLPFPTWAYKPLYLPENLEIEVARDIALEEPLWFYSGFAGRQDAVQGERRQPLQAKGAFQEVTAAVLTLPTKVESEPIKALSKLQQLTIMGGTEHLLELEFDNGCKKHCHDFRPELPLVLRW